MSLQTTELDQIEASIKSIVRRAYDLGRSDTLRKVVEELNALDPSAEPVAEPPAAVASAETVAAPEPEPVPPAFEVAPEPKPDPEFKPLSRPQKPWWARLGR
jgi:hypothetical protein